MTSALAENLTPSASQNVYDFTFPITPSWSWTAKNFKRGFDNLMVPITTATERQISNWDPLEVWEPYWQSIKDYCNASKPCQELISIIMAPAINRGLSTAEHRKLLQKWVDVYIPGYKLLWESDLTEHLNQVLEPRGRRVYGFQYGKDGRGALPDLYFYALVVNRYLPVGNHHDVLGHFILYAIPRIRKITEQIIIEATRGHFLFDEIRRTIELSTQPQSPERTTRDRNFLGHMRPALGLFTFAWNLAQEKLYYTDPDPDTGRARFSLMGAFNTVYNTTLSSRLPVEHLDSTVAGLGIFSPDPRRTIVMTPRNMMRWLVRRQTPTESSELAPARRELIDAIDNYAEVLKSIGWTSDPRDEDVAALGLRFKEIVRENLFAEMAGMRLPMRFRWRKFGRAIANDAFFSKVLCSDSMLKISEAQTLVAAKTVSLEQLNWRHAGPQSARRS